MGGQPESSGKHHDVFVLSGGAARGAVQVGMMEGLLEHGIVPDALVGTSVGALNAAFLGWRNDRVRIQELRARWLRLSTQDIFPGGNLTRMGHLLRRRPYLFSPAALSRLLADLRPPADPVFYSLSTFYREEFVKCQRCLDEQREYYSESAISDVERALTRVMSQIDRLCTEADADQVVSRLLQQFDVVTGLFAWTDPRQVN